ncbi:MAG: hypothetical protein ISS52_07710 [Dehalococcoidia bacterium]|nr:hypothetical protein [Dehalococcoidia bacterium]
MEGLIHEYDSKVVRASGWGIVFPKPLAGLAAKCSVFPNLVLGINAAVLLAAVLVALLFA